MTFPNFAQPGPRPGPPPGGYRPAPVPGAYRPQGGGGPDEEGGAAETLGAGDEANGVETGHPAVDAVLRSLANAARLAPAEQIAEYEAAHQVLQETLATIDR